MKVLLLNGPPGSGKDLLGELICNRLQEPGSVYYQRYKMSQPLKDGICAAFHLPFEYLEARKDRPLPELHGRTFRQLQISMSEDWLKSLYSQRIFGEIAVRHMRAGNANVWVVTDSGFTGEALPIVEEFGQDNVTCLQLYRQGCDFSADSRGYIDAETLGIRYMALANNSNDPGQFFNDFITVSKMVDLI